MAFNLNTSVSGLRTLNIGIPETNEFLVSGKLQLPTIDQGDTAVSSVVVTITQTPNGGSPTTIYTGTAGARGFAVMANCTALDTIAVAMTSAAAVDQGINAVKTTISVG